MQNATSQREQRQVKKRRFEWKEEVMGRGLLLPLPHPPADATGCAVECIRG
jgi:hypothetical protein